MSARSKLGRVREEQPVLSLLLAALVVELVGAAGSVFTMQGMDGWYQSLQQPEIAPPSWVFAPVWTSLFALMGVACWLVWGRFDTSPSEARFALGVFAVHFAFNLGWSAAFFGLQSTGLGLAVIAVLWVAIVAAMWSFARVDLRAAALLVPYLLWVTFAASLNYRYWVLN